KEVFLFLRKDISDIDKLRDKIIKNTKKLVKRQLTWLRKDNSIRWIPFEKRSSIMKHIEMV
ncbi:MAG: tRNA delta(2)-isopentenylpyrophosphate transferase, partial [bacterium]